MKFRNGFFASLSLLLAFSVSLPIMSGCAGARLQRDFDRPRMLDPTEGATWANYIPNRIHDLLDIGVVGVQFGLGFNIRFQFTSWLRFIELVDSEGPEIGWNTTFENPIRDTEGYGEYFNRRHAPYRFGAWRRSQIDPEVMEVETMRRSPDQIDIGGHLIVVGGHVGFRIYEALDFLAGFILLDLNSDDMAAPAEPVEPSPVEESESIAPSMAENPE